MNERSDIDRVLHHWFGDGPSTMPDRVVDVVAERIAVEHQRPARRLPWRLRDMNPTLKIGAAIAAVLVIALVGWSLLPVGPSGVGGPSVSTSTSPSPSETLSSSPTAPPLVYSWPGPLAAGTYATSLVWDLPFAVEFTVPDGWSGYDIEISKSDDPSLSVEFVLVDNVYSDPCGETSLQPAVGSSVERLATALVNVPGLDVTTPTEVGLDRTTRGVYAEYTVRDDAGCVPTAFALWDLPTDRFLSGKPNGGDGPKYAVADQGRIWILDVDDERFVIRSTWDAEATQVERDELQAIVDSIGIVRPANPDASPSPQPAP